MTPLEHENNSHSYCKNVTHGQPIRKQISFRPYKLVATFNGYFYKEYFLD